MTHWTIILVIFAAVLAAALNGGGGGRFLKIWVICLAVVAGLVIAGAALGNIFWGALYGP